MPDDEKPAADEDKGRSPTKKIPPQPPAPPVKNIGTITAAAFGKGNV